MSMTDTKRNSCRIAAISTLAVGLFSANAMASQVTYQPVNPVFQPGNPLAGPTLLTIAEAQRPNDPSAAAGDLTQRSIAETVRAAFLSRLTSDIFNQVFGDDPANSGTFDLGDGNIISFVRTGGNVVITFVDPISGTTTITVPDTM